MDGEAGGKRGTHLSCRADVLGLVLIDLALWPTPGGALPAANEEAFVPALGDEDGATDGNPAFVLHKLDKDLLVLRLPLLQQRADLEQKR